MSDNATATSGPWSWRRPMTARDPRESHRQASFLELFFDLCFVVAVAQAAAVLHHALAADHAGAGLVGYFTVFFAIWWAWMNFTWFASAYDNDDGPYRVGALVQIAGALVLAAGIRRGFEAQNYDVIFAGYAVMRLGLVALWLRAARHDPARRAACLRYAAGVSLAMGGWSIMLIAGSWPLWAWWSMALVEMAIPVWAERAAATTWHPHHIAERYGLFTIIVLGESVLAATTAVQAGFGRSIADNAALLGTIGGGLLILFSLWWLYFARPAHQFLTSTGVAFVWGYGHYFIFASAAAIGAGFAVNVDHLAGNTQIGDTLAAATVTVPVAVFLLVLWLLQLRLREFVLLPAAAVLVLAATAVPWPIPVTGLALAAVVAASIVLGRRARHPARA